MKRAGILNAELAGALGRLGHTDLIVIGDCGLPRPAGVPVIDLALVFGVPTFEQVVRGVLAEIVAEGAVLAVEAEERNPGVPALVRSLVDDVVTVPHEEFKRVMAGAVLFVRTGEATPYANVLLRCGVPF